LNKKIKSYLMLFLVSGTIIALDQITKAVVRNNLSVGEVWSPWEWMTPYARIVHWYNTGVVFGLFQGMGGVFTIMAILVSLAIIYYFPRVPQEDWSLRVAMCLQLAGALGNMIDRITVGHVTDFISVGTFPVFNVADSSITIGVVVLIIGFWLQERKQKKLEAEQAARQDSALDELPSQDGEAL